jgi:phosphatidylethanolamine-binding protein
VRALPSLDTIHPADRGAEVNSAPTISLTPANASVSLTGNYTLMMVDADIVGAPADNNTRHWLVNGATISGDALSNATANAPEPYAGPGPAPGSGAHRYVLLLLAQPANFSNPADLPQGVVKINLAQYIQVGRSPYRSHPSSDPLGPQESNLGAVVAATYIQVQNGVSTVSVSATSAVVTSTLAAAQSSASGGASGASSGSGASPTSSKSSGAARLSASGLVLALAGALAVL